MFTGIVEEIGTIQRVERRGQSMVLSIAARRIAEDVRIGDSIAVNGVCLTVVAFDGSSVTAEVMPETFRRSTLHLLTLGDKVNLERALPAGGRLGGHIVQGHIDAIGTVLSRGREENAVVFRIAPSDPAILRYVVSKGSVAVDGISLTVVDVTPQDFSVSIIPHTLEQTILSDKRAGQKVNLETDILGRYVEKLLMSAQGGVLPPSSRQKSGITAGFLAEHGFM